MHDRSICGQLVAIVIPVAFLMIRPSGGLHAENNTYTLISGTVSNHGGSSYYVGNSGCNNGLGITNAGVLTNVTFGYVGFGGGASNNSAIVAGANSAWHMSSDLYVGSSGASNYLAIVDGGSVLDNHSIIGASGSASNNTVIVMGAASAWRNGYDLSVGDSGSRNVLVVTNGGAVFNNYGRIGTYLGANSNAVLVSGSGSVWSNRSSLGVGNEGAGNTLTVTESARVFSTGGSIGATSNANLNSVRVTGSVWTNSGELRIGTGGSGNTLAITNGSTLFSGNFYMATDSNSSCNAVFITGSNSAWYGGVLTVGERGFGNSLTVIDGGAASVGASYIGYYSEARSNTVLVEDAAWTNNGSLRIGYYGDENALIITNGGIVVNGDVSIGYYGAASDNAVVVAGPGGRWHNSGTIAVGYSGSRNRLIITNGAAATISSGMIGQTGAPVSNTVIIAGSVWSDAGPLTVGNAGSGNLMTIAGGGIVSNTVGSVGQGFYSSNNAVVVTGTDSRWHNSGSLTVGHFGFGSTLAISNGGTVFSAAGLVGDSSLGSSNAVIVTGSGSVWSNSGSIGVGSGGVGCALTIANGGSVCAGSLMVFNGARLGGDGTISANVTNSGTLSPGASAGRIDINGRLLLTSTSNLRIELGGYTPATGFDYIGVTSAVTVGGSLAISLTNNFQSLMTNGASFTVLAAGNTIAGSFANIASGGTLATTDGYARFTVLYAGATTLSLTGLQIVDTDADGMPDWWEDQFGFSKTNAADAVLDTDGDGVPNVKEFLARTDPTSSASLFRIIAVAREGSDMRLTWTTVGGGSYVLQTNSTLSTYFADLSPLIFVPGPGESVTNYLHNGGATNSAKSFYRVRLAP